jgi:sugar (pentulose or hexulose) kinase
VTQTEPGCGGLFFLPLGGPRGGFAGLRLDHTRAEMGRAVLEGAAFEVRRALADLQACDLPVTRLWLVGGAARSPLWPGIVADVTGARLALADYAHWSALGAAILAGVGVEAFDTVEAGQRRLNKPVRFLAPDENRKLIYDERFAVYRQLLSLGTPP